MKAIVHIGAPKTGSSSIQEFLFLNAKALAKQGFRFHRNVKDRGSQFEYALAAMSRAEALLSAEDARIRYNARTLEEQADKTRPFIAGLQEYPTRWNEHTAIFSSEHILPWLHRNEWIRALDELFSEVFTDVRYVVYFRAQADLVLSQYSERIKRGTSVTLEEFIDRRMKNALNHFRAAKRWADTVGEERLEVRLLDPDFLRNGDLIEDFCSVCGIDPAPLSGPPRANPSLNATAAECLQWLNAYMPEILPEGGYNPLRAGLLQSVVEKAEGGPKLALLPEELAKLNDRTAASNEKLRRRFFRNRKKLFTTEARTTDWQSRLTAKDQALDIMAQMLTECRTEIRARPTPSATPSAPSAPALTSKLKSMAKRIAK